MRICIVVAKFYPEISSRLLKGATEILKRNKLSDIKIVYVPGVFEIPTVIANLVDKYDGFVALGCVVKGKTPHFDFLCNSTFNAIANLSVNKKIPIGNAILTCNNKNQALIRSDIKKINKGADAAKALISIFNIIKKWKTKIYLKTLG